MKKHATFVTSDEDIYADKDSIEIFKLKTIQELYPLLTSSKFETDLIVIDIKNFYDKENINCFELLDTLSTLTKMFHPTDNFYIAVLAPLTTDPYKLKELLGTNIAGILPQGEFFSLEEKQIAIKELLSGVKHTPKKINFLLKNLKKYAKMTNEEMTFRQKQIYTLVRDRGLSNKSIAKLLDISESAVKSHVSKVFKKLGVHNRTQLAIN